jgi:predicted transcriptional regulator
VAGDAGKRSGEPFGSLVLADSDLLSLTGDIVSAMVFNNTVDANDVPGLIRSVHGALAGLNADKALEIAEPEFVPATTIRKSLANPDKIISMIDGQPYSMLKRHLAGNGLTPEQYRERYKLPRDYPMVSASYAATRKALALKIGLGTKRMVEAVASVAETAVEAVAPKPRGRPPRAVEGTAQTPAPAKRAKLSISAARGAAENHLKG